MWSATRMASVLAGMPDAMALIALGARHHGGHGGRVARFNTHIDDRDIARIDRSDCLGESCGEIVGFGDRAETLRPLRACDAGNVDIGFGNTLADPAVLDGPVADAGDALLVQLVVEE